MKNKTLGFSIVELLISLSVVIGIAGLVTPYVEDVFAKYQITNQMQMYLSDMAFQARKVARDAIYRAAVDHQGVNYVSYDPSAINILGIKNSRLSYVAGVGNSVKSVSVDVTIRCEEKKYVEYVAKKFHAKSYSVNSGGKCNPVIKFEFPYLTKSAFIQAANYPVKYRSE